MMVTHCDICGEDTTPTDDLIGEAEEFETSETITLNGNKLDLCLDCYMAISEWVVSDEAKTYCAKYKKEQEEDQAQ